MFPSFPAALPALCEEAVVEVKLICTVRVHGCTGHLWVRSAGAVAQAGDFPLLEEGLRSGFLQGTMLTQICLPKRQACEGAT